MGAAETRQLFPAKRKQRGMTEEQETRSTEKNWGPNRVTRVCTVTRERWAARSL